jgi:hypothetical protein
MHAYILVCLFILWRRLTYVHGVIWPYIVSIPPAMYIGPSFKNEPVTPCRAFEHLDVLSSTSQDKVSLEASNAGNDTLLPNVW